MKKILLLLLAMAPMFVFSQQTKKQFPSPDNRRYWEYLPPGYSQSDTTKKYNVVIFLHGQGQQGDGEADMDKIVNLPGTPPNYAKTHNFPFILLSPQLSASEGGWYPTYVQKMIRHANKYNTRHIYIVGLSLGGGGTWEAAVNLNLNEPTAGLESYRKVKGVVTVCGTNEDPIIAQACNVVQNHLRVWAIHGTADTQVEPGESINMVNAINACVPAPSTPAQLSLYTNEPHEIWGKAFSLTNDHHLPNIYQWIMSSHPGTPIANAGSDVATTSSSITIDGSGTDSDGSVVSHLWTQFSGPNTATLSGNTTPSLTVSNLIPGVYKFRLQVTDNYSWPSTPDEVTVTVTNPPPVVNAGADKLINESSPTSTTLTGSATDDGTITYAWTKLSGGAATLTNANTATVSLTNLVWGTYVFRLTATDNFGGSSYDDVTLTVNKIPTSLAGVDLDITLPTNAATFTGSGTDADGTIAAYLWSQYEGPTTATFTNETTATVTVSNLVVGKYGFRLRVKDNNNASGYDYMTVTVHSSARQSTETESITLAELESQAKRCDDCSIVIYNMSGKRFYSGLFDYEQYKYITQSLQLYCYTLMRNNKKIDTGKVFQKK